MSKVEQLREIVEFLEESEALAIEERDEARKWWEHWQHRGMEAEAERDRLREAWAEEHKMVAKIVAERDRLKAHVARHREQMDDYERLEALVDEARPYMEKANSNAGPINDWLARAALDKEKT